MEVVTLLVYLSFYKMPWWCSTWQYVHSRVIIVGEFVAETDESNNVISTLIMTFCKDDVFMVNDFIINPQTKIYAGTTSVLNFDVTVHNTLQFRLPPSSKEKFNYKLKVSYIYIVAYIPLSHSHSNMPPDIPYICIIFEQFISIAFS